RRVGGELVDGGGRRRLGGHGPRCGGALRSRCFRLRLGNSRRGRRGHVDHRRRRRRGDRLGDDGCRRRDGGGLVDRVRELDRRRIDTPVVGRVGGLATKGANGFFASLHG